VRESPRIGRLCVITDTAAQERFTHEDLARLALEGGAGTIQLRDKTLSEVEMTEVARRILALCKKHDALLIVNDRIVVARAAEADGVHLGRTDATVAEARRVLGERAIVGATAGTLEQALAAEAAGADYIGFGHIFATTSKQKPGAPVGLDTLARACAAVRIPVLAIGGVTEVNARSCVEAGAWGVAVIAAVCAAEDPRQAARRIRAALPD
jgi:thiamine-phosphate pyrophosphorylase